MKYPTQKQFRLLAWLNVLVNVVAYCLILANDFGNSDGALSWAYYGAWLPATLLRLIWAFVSGIFILGHVLFALGFSWSRWLLVCLVLLNSPLNLISGMYVSTALEDFVSSIGMWTFWILFVLSFFEPCSRYFSGKAVFGTMGASVANNMEYPTQKQFKVLAWLNVLLTVISYWVVPVYEFVDSDGAFSWLYYGACLPATLLYPVWNSMPIIFLVCYVLFALGLSWSRWLLICLVLLTLVLILMSGIYVSAPLYNFMSLGAFAFFVPFVLSFFGPCSTYLSRNGSFRLRA